MAEPSGAASAEEEEDAQEDAAAADAHAARYNAHDYWDERYERDVAVQRAFEWYAAFPALRGFLRPYVPRHADVLHVGCGNSPWAADMVADGHTGRVANVDLSRVIIEYMAEKYAHLPPAVSWDVADVTALDAAAYADASFDAVIDKGTMDALMCGGDSVGNTNAMAREMMRVLRPGGVFIMITYGDPSTRLHVFTPLDVDVTLHCVGKMQLSSEPPAAHVGPLDVTGGANWEAAMEGLTMDAYHFIYVARKRGAPCSA